MSAIFTIIAGVPAKVIKYRFSIEEALEHESKIYHPENRYTKQYLEQSRL